MTARRWMLAAAYGWVCGGIAVLLYPPAGWWVIVLGAGLLLALAAGMRTGRGTR